jgi:hypothetical protein
MQAYLQLPLGFTQPTKEGVRKQLDKVHKDHDELALKYRKGYLTTRNYKELRDALSLKARVLETILKDLNRED